MGNADPDLLAICRYQIGDNESQAVIDILEALVAIKRNLPAANIVASKGARPCPKSQAKESKKPTKEPPKMTVQVDAFMIRRPLLPCIMSYGEAVAEDLLALLSQGFAQLARVSDNEEEGRPWSL